MGQKLNLATSSTGGFIPVMPPPIIALRDPTTTDTNYPVGIQWFNKDTDELFVYKGAGIWGSEAEVQATETVAGIAEIATLAEALAGTDDTTIMTPAKVAAVAIAGAPLWSEVTPGIVEKASQAEAEAAADDTVGMTPLKTSQLLAAGNSAGAFTSLDASGAVTFSSTGAISMTSDTASLFDVTGAGIDLTLSSDAGRVIVNGEEAAANAITLLSAAGGIDVDAALQINIASSQNAVDAIRIVASAGGIDIDAVGAATEDINITNTGGSIVISATENVADSIVISSTAGGIDMTAAGGAGEDIDITNTAGSIRLTSGEAVADSMVFASSGGIDVDAVGQVNIASSQSAADSIVITSSAGGIDILAAGAAAGEDIDIIATGSSVNIAATENDAGAITIGTNGGTSERITVTCSQGTNAASIGLTSTAGGITLTGGLGTADAINIVASNAAGGIDIDAGTGGIIADTTANFSIDGATASNVTVTGAGADLTLSSVGGSVLVSSTEDAALAIRLHANGGTSETIQVHADQGTGVASVGLLSDVGGITIRATGLASADAINLEAAAGGIDADAALQINVASSQAAATAIQLTASDAAGGISATVGTGGFNIAGDLNLSSVATKMSMNGGAATDFIGRATLVAGTVTVNNTNIAAGDRIFLTRSALNASPALGFPITSISAGASFTIASYDATGGAVATDVSTFDYVIVRQT